MDFSFFERKKQIIELTEVIVVDFQSRTVIGRKTINNLLPSNPVDFEEIAQLQAKNPPLNIEKSNKIDNLEEKEIEKLGT